MKKHLNGVRMREDLSDTSPPFMQTTVGLDQALLGVTIHSSKATSEMALSYSWRKDGGKHTFIMTREKNIPFPTSEHAVIFYALMAMFASACRDDGALHFRFADVLTILGKPNETRNRNAIKEAIKRYTYAQFDWLSPTRYDEKGKEVSVANNTKGSFIDRSDFWTRRAKTAEVIRLPTKDDYGPLHCIRFNKTIVDNLSTGMTRIFLTAFLQRDISADAKCLYAYFYSFSDRSVVERTLEQLRERMNYRSRNSRFVVFLDKLLNELKAAGLVDKFTIVNGVVGVTCVPLKKLTTPKQIVTSHKRPAWIDSSSWPV